MSRVVIIENGGANLASLVIALERLGCTPQLSSDAQTIRAASHVILPGVGAAADSMARLRARGLHDLIPSLRQPVLGICLGMQLLYEASDEGNARCLSAIPGTAKRFTAAPDRPVPHMGWNQLEVKESWIDPSVNGMNVYFVHSYFVPVNSYTSAITQYIQPFSAAMHRDNFYAVQFHPEKSSVAGEKILESFLKL